MTFRVYVTAVILLTAISQLAVAELMPPQEILSPKGNYSIRMLDKQLPGADFYFGDQTIALYHGRKLLSQFPTTGFLLEAYWSPDGRFLAVNNRRGHEGDYLWVFALRNGRVLKRPDDRVGEPKTFVSRITAKFPQCTDDSLFRYYLVGQGWQAPNKLKVRTDVRFYHVEPQNVLIDDVYSVSDRSFKRIKRSLQPAPPDT